MAKLTLIIAIAAVVMTAKFMPSGEDKGTTTISATAVSISPAELTRAAGPLPETRVESLF